MTEARSTVARRVPLGPVAGAWHLPACLDGTEQRRLLDAVSAVVEAAPFTVPRMPRSGRPFSVRMTNCGALGWVSDEAGYRYQAHHPETGRPWPAMPPVLGDLWDALTGYDRPPEAGLSNLADARARLGLHRDEDEVDFAAPVLAISLGDTGVFRIGGLGRKGRAVCLRLAAGEGVILGGEARLAFHGIDRILPGTCALIPGGGRINLTLRRVTRA